MENKIKLIVSCAVTLFLIVLGIVFLGSSASKYSILLFTIAFVMIIVIANKFFSSNDDIQIYEKTIKKILNTYDSILVRSNSVPSLEGKNIISVLSIDDMVDAQLEIKKPICYIKQTESTSFVLLDEKEAYVHTIKLYDNTVSPLDIELENINIKNKKNNKDVDYDLLKDIEKTTIVILPNKKSFKVSPVREKLCSNDDIEILE